MSVAAPELLNLSSTDQAPDRDALIRSHVWLVQSRVNNLAGRLPSPPREDMEADGYMGLIDAATRFDPERGVQFITFARWRIDGAILDGIRRAAWGVSRRCGRVRLLPVPIEVLGDVPGGTEPDQVLESHWEAEALSAAVDALPPQMRQVVRLRFWEEMKVDDIARALGVTDTRIFQILKDARARLAASLKGRL